MTENAWLLNVGAIAMVLVWIGFTLINGQFDPGLNTALALLVLAAAFGFAGISLSAGALRFVGYFVGVNALVSLATGLRHGVLPTGTPLVGYVFYLIAAATMFAGAVMMSGSTDDRASS